MLEVKLLGTLEVVRDGRVVELPRSRAARALFAYLVATGRSHSRRRLCDLLWGGAREPRTQLRDGLTSVRALLGTEASRLVEERSRVAFVARGAAVDVRAVRGAVARGLERLTSEELGGLAARFRGELLEGLDLAGRPAYRAWCAAEREEARRLHAAVLSALADRLDDRPGEALPYARGWLGLEPHAEAAHAAVVRLLGRLGRSREALEQYERCRRILKRELGGRSTALLDAARLGLREPNEGLRIRD